MTSATAPSDKLLTLIFLRRDDQILLAMKKRGFGSGKWNGIGGKVEPGETIEQALVRECQEEIGVTPLSWDKVAVHDFVMDSDSAAPWHMHVHAYVTWEWDGEPMETEEMAPRWFAHADIPYEEMWEDDIFWLPGVLAGKRVRTRFRFDGEEGMIGAEMQIVQQL